MSPTEDRIRAVFNTLEQYIEQTYGIPVIIKDVQDPFTGDLDGAEIHVDYASDIDQAVFIAAHLFGHTVQWNLSEDARRIGYQAQENPTEQRLEELERYEREACSYSLQLLHDAGIFDLDQWLSDFAACDFAYLKDFYQTGRKRPFRDFWKDRQPLLQPLKIPEFQPVRWIARCGGIVV
jgi:hypothetical protein